MQPFFSIVVPTLNRCDTLRHTLDTIIDQNYEAFELIISDNCSSDETEAIVRAAQKKRANVRYIKPPRTLSMSRHWEFALSHTQGEYVAFVGDDDGMVPNALPKAHAILQQFNQPDALASLNCEYHWPSSPLPGHSNIARCPLSNEIYERDSQDYLKKICSFDIHYRNLPLIYNGFVKKYVISKVKSKTGIFFRSCIPDVYSGIAVASQTESFVFSEAPLFIYGVSGHSNGANSSLKKSSDKSFFTEDTIPFHKKIPYCVSIPFLVAESIYQCIDAKIIDESFSPDPEKLAEKAIRGSQYLGKERYAESIDAIQIFANQFNFNISHLVKKYPLIGLSSESLQEKISWSDKILERNAIGFNLNMIGVNNIYDYFGLLPKTADIEKSALHLFMKINHQQIDCENMKNNSESLANQISLIRSSLSWKITKPLRTFHNLALKFQGKPYF